MADGTPTLTGDVQQAVGGKSKRPRKRTELLFQRIKDTNKRYRPVNQKVVSESKHTLTLANEYVLRKSGVAGKAINPNAPKISENVPKPPTMSAVKRRAELNGHKKSRLRGQVPGEQLKLERELSRKIGKS